MSQNPKGTFASGQSSNVGQTSPGLRIPSSVTVAKLTLGGTVDASNTVKTIKSIDNGITYVDQVVYNAPQTNTPITVAHGEVWRLQVVSQQPLKTIDHSFSVES